MTVLNKTKAFPIPVLGFCAYSGTGKTTLLEQLLPKLTLSGLRIGLIKQTHHDIELDSPHKDSYRLRKAGAVQTLLASPFRHILFTETAGETSLEQLVAQFDPNQQDLIIIEGGKQANIPKIELHRAILNKPWLYPRDPHIIALITDETAATHLPQFHFQQLNELTLFVLEWFASQSPSL